MPEAEAIASAAFLAKASALAKAACLATLDAIGEREGVHAPLVDGLADLGGERSIASLEVGDKPGALLGGVEMALVRRAGDDASNLPHDLGRLL